MFSNSTKYALRTVLYLAEQVDGQIYTVKELAKHLDIPKPFLSKILQQLSKSELISSTKGRGGGFFMSSQNKSGHLIEVIICVEGHNVFQKCILGLSSCDEKSPCFLHNHYMSFKDELNDSLHEHSIGDIASQDYPSFLQIVNK